MANRSLQMISVDGPPHPMGRVKAYGRWLLFPSVDTTNSKKLSATEHLWLESMKLYTYN